jgi:glyoxylase-like metal-dependent hydrolase (beta-lactamase superfamily II)
MMNLSKVVLGLVVAEFTAFGTVVSAQQQAPPVTVTNIKDNVYWVRGGGGSNDGVGSNNAFIVGTSGVIVVDTKTTVDVERRVIAEISKTTPKAIDTVILTHSDEDHVGGLPAFPSELTIIAQENCKNQMEASLKLGFEPCRDCRTQGQIMPPQRQMPTKTFAKTDILTIDGVHIRLYHWGPAHTSGDAAVYLPDEKVVFAGDLLVTTHPDPLIHVEKDGSAVGWLESAKGLLSLNADTYLTGHGGIMTKADVRKKYELVRDRYSKVKAMAEQGKSLDEIRASLDEPPPAAFRNPSDASASIFTGVIYKEVSKKPLK